VDSFKNQGDPMKKTKNKDLPPVAHFDDEAAQRDVRKPVRQVVVRFDPGDVRHLSVLKLDNEREFAGTHFQAVLARLSMTQPKETV
jgi:urease beta subunit